VKARGDYFVVTTPMEAFAQVETALDDAGIAPEEGDLVRLPTTTVALPDDQRGQVEALLEAIADHDDVDAVYTTLPDDDEAPVEA
jgi:transcriptional/translational regulatory protein YebC/TACO1